MYFYYVILELYIYLNLGCKGIFWKKKKFGPNRGGPLNSSIEEHVQLKKNIGSKLNPKNTIFLLFILFLLLVIVSITFLALFMGLVLFKSLMVLFQLNFSFIYHTLSKKISISAKINYFQMNTKWIFLFSVWSWWAGVCIYFS